MLSSHILSRFCCTWLLQNLTLEEMNQMSTTSNDEHWLNLITQCRSSGLTDRQWCIKNGIPVSTFYYHVRALRKKACEVPEAVDAAAQKQEVVQIPLWEREQHSDTVALHTPSICLEMQGMPDQIEKLKLEYFTSTIAEYLMGR